MKFLFLEFTKAMLIRLSFLLWSVVWVNNFLFSQTLDEKTWPLARGNSESQAFSPSKLPDNPILLWEHKIESTAFESTPLIVDNRVYLGDLDGEFYALDLETGNVLWKNSSESGYLAGAALHQERIIVGDYDGLVRCFNVKDGKQEWTFETDSQIDGGPNFHEGTVLIASEDGKLYSIDMADGKLRWSYETGDQLRCGPTIAGGKTFLGGCDGKLHIVDLATGTSIGDGVPLDGPTGSTPAAVGDLVIAPTHSGQIFGIDWKKGKTIWTFSDSQLAQEIVTSPAIHDGSTFVITKNRRCLAIDVATGKLRWEYTLRKPSDASPVVCDGRIWFGCSDGRLIAIDEKTGQERWQAEHQGKLKGCVAIASEKLVIASDKGSIFCYGEAKH
jgi:outer membrane protein assembly factor BamB